VVAQFLKEHGYRYFLVEAGGDMYGTKKADGSAFQIALEWPGKPGIAFGTIELRDQGLAVSDSFRRRWPAPVKNGQEEYDWHHIIDPQTKTPIKKIIGCTATARTAFEADCMTSGLFLSATSEYEKLQKEFNGEYVVFTEDEKVLVSPAWPGVFFTENTELKK
jgi:thiamine biosynthesis lipoprotein